METSAEQRSGFGVSKSTPVGALLTVSVPLLLLWVHTLPRAVRRDLALAFGDPSLPTAFTAHFVHLSTGHLLSNLILYALIASATYLLARRTDQLRLFHRGFFTVVVAFPPVLSGLSVALGRSALGFGFSGVNMALFGLLTLLLGRFLARHFDVGVDDRGVVLFGFGVVLVTLRSLPTTAVTLSVAGGAGCLALASVVGHRRDGPRVAGSRRAGVRETGDLELALVAGFLFCVLPLVAFSIPESVAAGLGLYVHFLGYTLAFTVFYVADVAGLLA